MQVKQKPKGDVAVCKISGEINIDTAPELQKIFKKILLEKTRKILLNFKELDYIDSSGLACLIQFSKDLKGKQGAVFFSELSPTVRSLFAITKLESAFNIYDTQEEALRNFDGY